MLDVGLYILVSAKLHSVFQIDIRVVRNLCQTRLSGLMVAFLHKAQFFAVSLILFVNGLGGNSVATIYEDIIFRFSGEPTLQIVLLNLGK